MNDPLFHELFVLELANNHWGDLTRGMWIINDFARVVHANGVRAAIKLQFRDTENFIHKDFRQRTDIRYIKKTLDTRLPASAYAELVKAIRDKGCIPCATPFDERSVDLCVELDVGIVKVASSDIDDWPLLSKIASTCKPVVASTGGASLHAIDHLVCFFDARNIQLGLNHCVSIYPSEDHELELNQLDLLKNRYPGHTIGFSTHEYHDWTGSMLLSYAKGARMWERHIDVLSYDKAISPYCSQPEQIDTWFKAFKKAKEMCGIAGTRTTSDKERQYLDTLLRGVYAKRDLPIGHVFSNEKLFDDIYLAIPAQPGQLACNKLLSGLVLQQSVAADQPIMRDVVYRLYGSCS